MLFSACTAAALLSYSRRQLSHSAKWVSKARRVSLRQLTAQGIRQQLFKFFALHGHTSSAQRGSSCVRTARTARR